MLTFRSILGITLGTVLIVHSVGVKATIPIPKVSTSATGSSVESTCAFHCKTPDANEKKEMLCNTICSSNFGGFPDLQTIAQTLATKHLETSMKFLMMSTQFSNWKTQRNGFSKLFDSLSDSTFNDAVNIIQYMAKRGGRLNNFKVELGTNQNYNISEIDALAQAVDVEKGLAKEILEVTNTNAQVDSAFAHFLVDEVSEKHVDRIHILTGHVNNLWKVIFPHRNSENTRGFVIHMFDTKVLG